MPVRLQHDFRAIPDYDLSGGFWYSITAMQLLLKNETHLSTHQSSSLVYLHDKKTY